LFHGILEVLSEDSQSKMLCRVGTCEKDSLSLRYPDQLSLWVVLLYRIQTPEPNIAIIICIFDGLTVCFEEIISTVLGKMLFFVCTP
jgi:hypothetical protein